MPDPATLASFNCERNLVDVPSSCAEKYMWNSSCFQSSLGQRQVADLKFPRRGGGAPTPKVGVKTYYLAKFFRKTAWKLKKLDPGGARVPGAPLTSATGRFDYFTDDLFCRECYYRFNIGLNFFIHNSTGNHTQLYQRYQYRSHLIHNRVN